MGIIKFWFCKFMYGESNRYVVSMYCDGLNYFKVKLLCLIIGVRVIFINSLNEYLIFHGYTSVVSSGLFLMFLRIFIAFVVDLVHAQVALDFVCYFFGLNRLDLFAPFECNNDKNDVDESVMGLGRLKGRTAVSPTDCINQGRVLVVSKQKYLPFYSGGCCRGYSTRDYDSRVSVSSITKNHIELVERLRNTPKNPWKNNIDKLIRPSSIKKFWLSDSSYDFLLYIRYVNLLNRMSLVCNGPHGVSESIMWDRGFHVNSLKRFIKKGVHFGGSEFQYVRGFDSGFKSPIAEHVEIGSNIIDRCSLNDYSDFKNTIIFDKLKCSEGVYYYDETLRFLIKGFQQIDGALVRLAAFDYKYNHCSISACVPVGLIEDSRFRARQIMGFPTDFIHTYGDNVVTLKTGGIEENVLIEDKYRKVAEVLGKVDVGVLNKFVLPDIFYFSKKSGGYITDICGTKGAYHFEVLNPRRVWVRGLDIYTGGINNKLTNIAVISESEFYSVIKSHIEVLKNSNFSEYTICGTNPSDRLAVPDIRSFRIFANIIGESDYAFMVRVNETDLVNHLFEVIKNSKSNCSEEDLGYIINYIKRINRVEKICSKEFGGSFLLSRSFTAYKEGA